jgi:hypothetical protein
MDSGVSCPPAAPDARRPVTTELRDYRIAEGHLDDFMAAWSQGVVPLRAKHGFRIDGAWVVRGENRFIWLLSLDADPADFERRNEAYYADPRRAAQDPDPAEWIEHAEHTILEPFEEARQ